MLCFHFFDTFCACCLSLCIGYAPVIMYAGIVSYVVTDTGIVSYVVTDPAFLALLT